MLSQLQHHSHHGFPVKLRRDGDGSMIWQLQHHVPDDVPVKMSALHDRIADSRVAGDDFGGLRPKDHSDSGTGSKQRDSGFIDFTPTPSHAKVYHGLNPIFFKKQAVHEDHSSASTSHSHAHDDHHGHHGNHTGFSITGLSTLSHMDPSYHSGLAMPMHSTRPQDFSDLSLGARNVEDHDSSAREGRPHHEDKPGSSQSTPLGHQTKHSKEPEHNEDEISSQSAYQPSHQTNRGDKSHELEINIGELPKHDRFNGPVEYLEGDHTISQHAPQHSQGTPSSVALGVGTGLVSLGAAAAAASRRVSNPPAVNYASQKAYDAPMTHHDGSSADRAAEPQGSFFTQPATYHNAPSHDSGAHAGNHAPTAHLGASEPHPSSSLAHHSVSASSMLNAHEQSSTSSSHVGPSHVVAAAAPVLLPSAAINRHNSAQPVHNAPVYIETIHEPYHGPTTQSAPVSGDSHKHVHIETIHKPYQGGALSASLNDTKGSELSRSGPQSSTSAGTASSVPLNIEPKKKKKWFGFEINEREKKPNRPPNPLALGFGFKEKRKAAMAAAKAGQAPPKASISAPISTPIATPSTPAAIAVQGVHAASNAMTSSSDPATVSVQGVHDASIAGPSSASVSSPAIVSVQPLHSVGRSSPAPHSFSPSQDRPVHPDVSYHTKKKSKSGGKSLFSAPVVPAGMSRSHMPPKAPTSAPAPVSAPVPDIASSSKKAPISSSDALSAHASGLTSAPVHSQHQHHINSPVTPEVLTAAIAAGTAAAVAFHYHDPPEKPLQHVTATPVNTAHAIPPHEHSTSATLKRPKVDLSLYPEEEGGYPRGEESHHENPAHPEHPVAVQEVQLDAEDQHAHNDLHCSKTVAAAHEMESLEHSTSATLKRPKVDLSLYPEEEGGYPRVQEVQLDAEDQHAHNDLHHSKTAAAASAVAVGLGSIKSAFNHIHLPGRHKNDTPKEVVAETTSTTTPTAVESIDATTADKETVHTDATPEKSVSDLASARAAASALATSPTPDNSKSKFVTSEQTGPGERSSISARKVEPIVAKSATTVLVTDKATSTDLGVGVSSHEATSNVPTAGSHPVHAEIGTSTHPVEASTTTLNTSKIGAAVPLTIAAAAVTAPLATHAMKKREGVDDKKATITSTSVHDDKTTNTKHIDKSTISKPISITPLVEDSTKEKVHHIIKEADPSSVTKISVAATPSSVSSVIPHKDDEEVIMLTTTTTTTVPEKDRKAPKNDKETHSDKPADDITNISVSPATPAVAAGIPHEADEEVVMMKTTSIQHVPMSSIVIAAKKVKDKINEKLRRKSMDKTAIVTETATTDYEIPIDSASASKTSSGVPIAAAAVASVSEPTHGETSDEVVATTVDDDTVKPIVASAIVETEKEKRKREKKELKKEQKELKAKEKAEKKALKEKTKKPPVDISGKLSSVAAPAVAAIAAASASPSNPLNKSTKPIKLKGQNFLLTESDVQHPTLVPVSQTLLLTEDDIVHPSVPIVSQSLSLTEDDVEHPSVPIVSQRLTMTEDDVEKPVLIQPAMPVLRVREEDVLKPDITHGHLVIPMVAPKAVSTSALKVARAPRPMIPPRPIKVKKEKVKTAKKMKLPVVRMPRLWKKKNPKVQEEKKPAVEENRTLATVPVVETVHVLETPKSKVVEVPGAVVPAAIAAAVALPPSPKPAVVEEVKTHHVGVPKPAAVAAVTTAAAIALPPSPKPAPVAVKTKVVEPPKPVVVEQVKPHVVEPPKPVPVVAPIIAAPVVAAAASSAPKPTASRTMHEYTPAVQKEEITAESSVPVVTTPEGYSGPIPSTQSGEKVVWVKKISTIHEYHDSEGDDDFDEFGYRKDRDPSRYLAPLPRGMSNVDQRVNYHIRNHTRPGSTEAYAQRLMPAQQQKQGIVGNTGGYNTQPRQSAF
ncbi:hypothetical protein BGZ74_000148 [Mortierella antarctica]|nr:hypothetical protein BGZ74_000148 [Mortierella antarctica]